MHDGRGIAAARNKRGLRGDVEGLRAVSILAVVLYHGADVLAPGGFIGVDVFFVISGFVITGSIVRRHDETGKASIVDFYIRRAKRILPALTTFLVVTLALVVLLGSAYELPRSRDTAAASAVFVANFQLLWEGAPAYFADLARENAFLHTWSLSVEEQFYLFFPLAVVGCLALARRRTTAAASPWGTARAVFLVLLFVSFVSMLVVGAADREAAFYLAPTRAWEFLAGAVLALTPRVGGRWATSMRLVGLALIGGSVLAISGTSGWPGPQTTIPVTGAALIIAAQPGSGRMARLLDNRPMRRIGELSYGWYLWHWPAIVLAEQAAPGRRGIGLIAGFVAIIPAAVSLWLIENPIRFSSRRRPAPVFGASMASIAALVVLALVVVPFADERLPGSVDDITEVADLEHIDITDGCLDGTTALSVCVRTVAANAPRAVLVGDSIAAQLAIPFHEAATASGMNSYVETKLSCAFLPSVSVQYDGVSFPGCDEHNSAVYAELMADPPDLVVMSDHLGFPLDATGFTWLNGTPHTATADAAQVLTEALTDVVADLEERGSRVVIVRRPPPTRRFSVYDCARWRWVIDKTKCAVTRPREVALEHRAPEDAIIDAVVADTDAVVVDPADLACDEICAAYRDGQWVYADNSHLTGQFVPRLTPLLSDAFQLATNGGRG